MVVLVAAWLFLAAVTVPVGTAVVSRIFGGRISGASCAPIFWSGLLAQAVFMQLLASFARLVPTGLMAAVAMALLSGALVRADLRALLETQRPSLYRILTVAVAAVAFAYVASSRVTYYDSGLYHIQALHWLARDGLVPGLALLHVRLGVESDWFALASIFDVGALHDRMTTVMGGYVLLLLSVQAAFALDRVWRRIAMPSDRLFVGAALVLIAHALWIGTAVSTSPDLAVGAIIVQIAWLIAREGERGTQPQDIAGASTLIAFFAAAAVAMKLSSLPIAAVAAFFVWRSRRGFQDLAMPAVAAISVLVPSVWASIILSGCPAFPSTAMCLALPWTIPPLAARNFSNGVVEFARWYAGPVQGNGNFDWIIPYFIHPGNRINVALLLLTVIALAAIFAVPRLRRGAIAANGGMVLALGLVDLGFVLLTAPDTRFAIGGIAVLIGQALASGTFSRSAVSAPSAPSAARPGMRVAPAAAAFGGIIMILMQDSVIERAVAARWRALPYATSIESALKVPLAARWLLPPALPVIYGSTRLRGGGIYRLREGASADASFAMPPLGDQCWGSDLPCTPDIAAPLRLRDPKRGLSAGFIRSEAYRGPPENGTSPNTTAPRRRLSN